MFNQMLEQLCNTMVHRLPDFTLIELLVQIELAQSPVLTKTELSTSRDTRNRKGKDIEL